MPESAAILNEETGLICQFGFSAIWRDLPSPHPEKALETLGLHIFQDVVIYNTNDPKKFWIVRRRAVEIGPLVQAFRNQAVPVFQ